MKAKQILFMLLCVYMFVSPYSLSQMAMAEQAKYGRLGILALMILVGLGVMQRTGLTGLSRNLVLFGLFNMSAALWSPSIAHGLFFKSFLLVSALAGTITAYSLHDLKELRKAVFMISLLGGAAGFVLFRSYLANPEDVTVMGRLSVGGINANLVGLTIVVPMVCALYMALSERKLHIRLLHSLVFCLMLWVLLATGSRAAILMLLACSGVVLLPFLRGKGMANLLAGVIAVLAIIQVSVMMLGTEALTSTGIERMAEVGGRNTRADVWGFLLRRFLQEPFFGHGWLQYGNSSVNFMNIYLQVLAETGLLGGLVLAGFMYSLITRCVRLSLSALRDPLEMAAPKMLAVGIVTGIMVHGVFESSTLLGTTTNSLFLGLACGLVDKLSNIVDFMPGPPGPWQVPPPDFRGPPR